MREVEWALFLRSCRPCWDRASVEVKHEGNQASIDRVEDKIMAGDFNDVFWPCNVGCFRFGVLFDDSTKTKPLSILVVNHETVATTGRAEVACDILRAVVSCEFGEGILRWR